MVVAYLVAVTLPELSVYVDAYVNHDAKGQNKHDSAADAAAKALREFQEAKRAKQSRDVKEDTKVASSSAKELPVEHNSTTN